MAKKTTILHLSVDDAKLQTVTSEKAARAVARRVLGCDRVSEHPTNDGWIYQRTGSAEDARCVRVRVG